MKRACLLAVIAAIISSCGVFQPDPEIKYTVSGMIVTFEVSGPWGTDSRFYAFCRPFGWVVDLPYGYHDVAKCDSVKYAVRVKGGQSLIEGTQGTWAFTEGKIELLRMPTEEFEMVNGFEMAEWAEIYWVEHASFRKGEWLAACGLFVTRDGKIYVDLQKPHRAENDRLPGPPGMP